MADFKAAHEDFWSSLSNEEAEEYREAIKTYFQRKLEYKSASEIAADVTSFYWIYLFMIGSFCSVYLLVVCLDMHCLLRRLITQ